MCVCATCVCYMYVCATCVCYMCVHATCCVYVYVHACVHAVCACMVIITLSCEVHKMNWKKCSVSEDELLVAMKQKESNLNVH